VYEELEGFAHAIRKHLQDLLGEEVTESLGAKASASKMFQSRNIEQRIRGPRDNLGKRIHPVRGLPILVAPISD